MKKTPPKQSEEWPICIKRGSVTVRIYSTPQRTGRPNFTIEWYENKNRQRKTRASLADARTFAKETAERIDSGGAGEEPHALKGSEREGFQDFVKRLKRLKPPVPFSVAADEYINAKKIGVSLVTAAKSYKKQEQDDKLPTKTVADVVAEFLAAKKADGRSVRYLQDCKARLERFQHDFKVNLKDVRTQELDAWLRGLGTRSKLSPRTRNNFRTIICSLFSFAKDIGYLTKGKETEAEHAAVADQDEGEIVIFSPKEFATLLAAADDHLLPFLVFGGLAGLRSGEIQRLTWECVDWAEGIIKIQGKMTKTGTKRNAPLVPAAAAWLKGYAEARGPVIGHIKLYERLENLSKSTGVPWRQNALRHSFCSCRMSMLKDAPRVSYEAGNSVRMIQQSYDKVVAESQGKLWFSVMPDTAEAIIKGEKLTA